MDQEFLDAVLERLREEVTPEPTPGPCDVNVEILRGLFSHSKLGENNHSSWDDLWKNRGQGHKSGAKRAIVKELCGDGILGWKPNQSAGGTGKVYWVADVAEARENRSTSTSWASCICAERPRVKSS